MATINFIFSAPSYGRSITDDKWETIEPAHIKLWKSAILLLATHEILAQGHPYRVAVDWTPTLRRHERHYSVMRLLDGLRNKRADPSSILDQFPTNPSRNEIRVDAQVPDPDTQIHMFGHIVECVLYDIFLIMNIAAPASCDFYRASLQGERLDREVSLSNYHFEAALITSWSLNWLSLFRGFGQYDLPLRK